MLPKDLRIRKQSDYKIILSRGKTYRTPYFIIRYRYSDIDIPRLGVIASKKVGSAVKRNFCKRMIRAAYQSEIKQLKGQTEIVIICLPSLPKQGYTTIHQALVNAFQKLNFYR